MITKSQMMPLMLEACPSFEVKWQRFLRDWADQADPPLYVALSELARHLSGMLARNEVASLEQVFAVIERWVCEGDPYVAEAATIGLLEDLQNQNLHDGTTPDQFREFLRPESKRWWEKLNQFWDGAAAPGTD